jgi:hypothetical protein
MESDRDCVAQSDGKKSMFWRASRKAGGSDCANSEARGIAKTTMWRRNRMLKELEEDIREHIERKTQDNYG